MTLGPSMEFANDVCGLHHYLMRKSKVSARISSPDERIDEVEQVFVPFGYFSWLLYYSAYL